MNHIFMSRFNDVPFNWNRLSEAEYAANGIGEIDDVENIRSYVVGKIMNANRTASFLYYGEDDEFIDDYCDELRTIQNDFDLQEQVGLFPVKIEKFGKKYMLSVTKLVKNPSMYIVDIMMDYFGEIYAYHTYLDKNEKDLSIRDLVRKYADIAYVVKKLEN